MVRAMRTRRFGPLSIEVPIIGLGTWNMERDEPKAAIAALRRGIELGLTHIDTAEMYGNGKVETLVAEAVGGLRDQVFLASKVLPRNATFDGTRRACESSLRRLATDRLDLYMLHWREASTNLAEVLRAFALLRDQGKIRAFGVSNFDDDELAQAEQIAGPGALVCDQVLCHLGERSIEHRVLPWCEQHDVACVAYSPFGSGRFPESPVLADVAHRLDATPRQVALAFLSRHRSMFLIPKTSNAKHVDEIAGADRVQLDDAAVAALDAAFPRNPWRGLPML